MTARDVWRWTDERGVQRQVGTDELRAALASSVLPSSTLVWREGMKEWAPASSLPELASAAFAAGAVASPAAAPANGVLPKAPPEPQVFDPRSTAERRSTLVGLHGPTPSAAPAPAGATQPVEVPSPGEKPTRPAVTQIPPFGGPAAEPRAPSVPRLPPTPPVPTPRPPATKGGESRAAAEPAATEKLPPKRKVATSEIDALWATTTHSDEDETIPRRVRPSELAAAAAASAEAAATLREARAKARLDALAKRADSERPPEGGAPRPEGQATAEPARAAALPPRPAKKPPPLPARKPAPDGAPAPSGAGKPPPLPTAKTSPGVGPAAPKPAAPPAAPTPPKPVIPQIGAPVRIKPPSAGPAADAISGTTRTVAASSLHVTLSGLAPPAAPAEVERPAPAAAEPESVEVPATISQPVIHLITADKLPRFPDDEATETRPRPAATPAPPAAQEAEPAPAAPAEPDPTAPAPAVDPTERMEVPSVLRFAAPESLPLPPATPAPPSASTSTRPPPSAGLPSGAFPSQPPPSLPPPGHVPVSVTSLVGAGAVLIGMVIAAFFVGRASTVPAPRLAAKPALGVVPALARASLPPPPKPCWMVKQPAMWAPKVSKSIPFDVAATPAGTFAVGYARDAKTAVGIEVDPRTGEIQPRFEDKQAAEIEHVVPAGAGFRAIRAGGQLRTGVEVPDEKPFAVGLDAAGIALASPPDAAPAPLWPLSGDEGLGAAAVRPAGTRGFVLTFRRGGAVWGGFVGRDQKAVGDLVKVQGSGGAVGKPAAGWNGREVGVIFADKPAADARYEIRLGRAPAGQVPSVTATLPLPRGGPGGDAFSPDIAGLSDGRWVIMWTEGAAGSRAVRAQTLAPDLAPLGDAIALSPPAGNYGSGAIGVAGGYTATVFLSKGEKSYELWGAVLQCQ